jgi:hypothetical protein
MTRFLGLEAPDQLLANPADLRKGYLAALNRFQTRLEDIVQRNAGEQVVMDTSRGIGDSLVDYLNRRSTLARSGRTGWHAANRTRWLPSKPDRR